MDMLEARNTEKLTIEEVIKDFAAECKSEEREAIKTFGDILFLHEDVGLTIEEDTFDINGVPNEYECISAHKAAYECLLGMAEFPDEFTWENMTIDLGRPSLGNYREIPIRHFKIKLSEVSKILKDNNYPIPKRWSLGDKKVFEVARKSIKNMFNSINETAWRNYFERDEALKSAESKRSRNKVYYDLEKVIRWLISEGHMAPKDIEKSLGIYTKSSESTQPINKMFEQLKNTI